MPSTQSLRGLRATGSGSLTRTTEEFQRFRRKSSYTAALWGEIMCPLAIAWEPWLEMLDLSRSSTTSTGRVAASSDCPSKLWVLPGLGSKICRPGGQSRIRSALKSPRLHPTTSHLDLSPLGHNAQGLSGLHYLFLAHLPNCWACTHRLSQEFTSPASSNSL